MRLDQMTDEALAAELKKQRAIQGTDAPTSQAYLVASRVIHHLSKERERRADLHEASRIAHRATLRDL